MNELHSTEIKNEKAILVSVAPKQQTDFLTNEYLDELEFLASTIQIDCKARFIQRLDKPDIKTFVGSGKLDELSVYIQEYQIDLVIFDDDLSPSQVRNLEKVLEKKIYDRSLLILDIFLYRAQTSQAKTQVELARSQYLLPRLTKMWSHLERQRGGTGTRGGSGEKELETDRRIIRNKIKKLEEKLEKIDKQNQTQRSNRGGIVRIALVGYTNVGKSTIMNILSKSNVFAENKLFATVDSTVRKVVINGIPFLLSDTVGFIRKLPHNLIECFKSTLDEIREADILVHMVDVSHPACTDHIKVVNETLQEINSLDKFQVLVFNKIDQFETEIPLTSTEDKEAFLNQSEFSKLSENHVFISAINKYNLDKMKRIIYEKAKEIHLKRYPNFLPENNLWEFYESDNE